MLKKTYGRSKKIVIFDIGGCNFEDAVQFKRKFPNARVFTFEPDVYNIENYGDWAEGEGVVVVPVALSDKDGECTFYPSKAYGGKLHRGSGSLLKPCVKPGTEEGLKHDGLTFDLQGHPVRTMRMDTFCGSQGIEHVDYVHIDVQGAESIVLSGLGELRPLYIFAETCEFETYESDMNLSRFDQFMFNLDYKIEARYESDTLYVHSPINECGMPSMRKNRGLRSTFPEMGLISRTLRHFFGS